MKKEIEQIYIKELSHAISKYMNAHTMCSFNYTYALVLRCVVSLKSN